MGGKPTAFKHQLSPERIRRIGSLLAEVAPAFDRRQFERSAISGLEDLELKARVNHIIACLHQTLPQPFERAVASIVAAVELDGNRRSGDERWLRGFAAWPLTDYLGHHGVTDANLECALTAFRVLTERFTAEFAIRPFLDSFPNQTLAAFSNWTSDPNEHIRRLVSEGTRPLLPWGQRLQKFRDDPSPVIKLLSSLRSDSSEYVRRSVANNLNDIAKDHPALVVSLCSKWSKESSSIERQRLVKRALRTLVKAGNPEALAILGFGQQIAVEVSTVRLSPTSLSEGGALEIEFDLQSKATGDQQLNIDYAVHYVKANGQRSAKVFKLKPLKLGASESIAIRKKHSMKKVTTRVHYPGTHTVEILLNGQPHGRADFELVG